jgi:hypothetical protein
MLLSLATCTYQPPRPVTPSSTPADTSEKSPEVDSWVPTITPGLRKYLISDSSNISINTDTTDRVVPIETLIHYSVAIEPAGDFFAISAKVDSVTLNSPLQTKAQLRDSTTSIELHGVLTKLGQLKFDSQNRTSSCSSSSSSTALRIYEIIIPYPRKELKIGDKWSDTVSTTSCHGKTPLIQETIREFEIRAFSMWKQHMAVEIQRITNTTFVSTSTDSNTHLQANGSGSGTTTLFFDRKSAGLLESNGQTKSVLMIVTSRGQFPFTQLLSTHATIQEP